MKKKGFWLGLLCCWLSNLSFAITIDISEGQDRPYPLAFVPFSSPDLSSADLPQGFSAVINQDLTRSGRFELLKKEALPEQPHQVESIHFGVWKTKAPDQEYLVVGQVQTEGKPDQYNVNYAIVSLVNNQILYGQKFQGVSLKALRSLAHFISDKIYETITGDRGYFSTRWAYVAERQENGEPFYQLVISDADGARPQVLLSQFENPMTSLAWSKTGKTLAYVSYIKNRMAVYTIDLATGHQKIIANFPGINSAPAFSPDAKSLAMALSLGKSDKTNLYLYDLSNQTLKPLTHLGTNTSPVFSPDGQKILFNSDRGGSPQLYLLHLSDLTVHPIEVGGVQNFAPSFLGNRSDEIAFMHQAERGGAIQIAVMNLNSGKIKVLTQGNLDKSPSASPNGKMVLYLNFDQDRGILSEVSSDARMRASWPSDLGSIQSVAWSPFLI